MVETSISLEPVESEHMRYPDTVTIVDEEVGAIKAGLQQWLSEYVAQATYIPEEGVTVELPGFGVDSAIVIKGDNEMYVLVNNTESQRVLAAV